MAISVKAYYRGLCMGGNSRHFYHNPFSNGPRSGYSTTGLSARLSVEVGGVREIQRGVRRSPNRETE